MLDTIQIPVGNECRLGVRPVLTDGSVVPVSSLSNIKVKVTTSNHLEMELAHTIDGDFIWVDLSAVMKAGEYDYHMTAKIGDRAVAMHRKSLFSRCLYDNGIARESYTTDFVMIGVSDEETQALQEALQTAITNCNTAAAVAEAKAAALTAKAAALDNMAKETTSQAILQQVSGGVSVDLSPVLDELQSQSYGLSQIQSTAQEAVDGIDTMAAGNTLGDIIDRLDDSANGLQEIRVQAESASAIAENAYNELIDGDKGLGAIKDAIDDAVEGIGESTDSKTTSTLFGWAKKIFDYMVNTLYNDVKPKVEMLYTQLLDGAYISINGEDYNLTDGLTEISSILVDSASDVADAKSMIDNDEYGLQVINGKVDEISTELTKIGTPAEGQPSTLFAAIAAGGSGGGGEIPTEQFNQLAKASAIGTSSNTNYTTLFGAFQYLLQAIGASESVVGVKALLQQIIDARITTSVKEGSFSYADSYSNVFNALNAKAITSIVDNEINSLRCLSYLNSSTLLTYVEMNNVTGYINNGYGTPFASCTNLLEIRLPKVTMCEQAGVFASCPKLRRLYMPLCQGFTASSQFGGDVNLIDLEFGTGAIAYVNIKTWSPTNALLTDSTSLLTEQDIADGFTSNRAKLLYNIREHIAAHLPNRSSTSALTFTVSAAIKEAINADADTAAAFTSKNWTIA